MGFLKTLYPTVNKEDEEPLHFKMGLCETLQEDG